MGWPGYFSWLKPELEQVGWDEASCLVQNLNMQEETVCRCRSFEEPEARDHPSLPLLRGGVGLLQRLSETERSRPLQRLHALRLGGWRKQSAGNMTNSYTISSCSTAQVPKYRPKSRKPYVFLSFSISFMDICPQVQETNEVPGPSPLHRFGTPSAQGNSQHCFDVHNEDGDLPDAGLQGIGFFLLAEVIYPKNPTWNGISIF